jgi:hypothetical protein
MSNNFFNYLKALYSKVDVMYDDKEFPPYLMLLWVSHDTNNFAKVELINKYLFHTKPKHIWNYLRYVLPKGYKFLKYIKKDVIDNQESAINSLREKYQISKYEAKKYL